MTKTIEVQQKEGLDTGSAFRKLGLAPDLRTFELAAAVISECLGRDAEIELLTNNPTKQALLKSHGVNVVKVRPLICAENALIESYLREKAQFLGHMVELDE